MQIVLNSIFVEKEEPVLVKKTIEDINIKIIKGLDIPHSELFYKISDKDMISYFEFESICKELSILPDGAIENINCVAFDKVGENLIDSNEDSLVLNNEVAKEMLA